MGLVLRLTFIFVTLPSPGLTSQGLVVLMLIVYGKGELITKANEL
jgi:hypothetical protein